MAFFPAQRVRAPVMCTETRVAQAGSARSKLSKNERRVIPGSWWCCRLELILFLWYLLLVLVMYMPCLVRCHEMLKHDLVSTQEMVQASWDRDHEVATGGGRMKVLIKISEELRRTLEIKQPPPAGGYDMKNTGLHMYHDGNDCGDSERIIELNAYSKGFEWKENDGLTDQPYVFSTLHNVEGSTFSCFSLTTSNLKRHIFGEEVIPSSVFSDKHHSAVQQSPPAAPNVAIVPPFLKWGPQSIFSPSLVLLSVLNTCNSSGLHVFQPFSTNSQFFILGLQENNVPPGGMISIPVIFLPTTLGLVEGLLVVQTSAGGFLVEVQGEGIGSPFHLQPLSGLSAVSGRKMKHRISFHNPYNEPLHVEEVHAWVSVNNTPSLLSELDPSSGKGFTCKRQSFMSAVIHGQANNVGWNQPQSDNRHSIGYGGITLELRPLGNWIIEPHCGNEIVDLEIVITEEVDQLIGSLCVRISRHSKQASETVILPLNVQSRKGRSNLVEVHSIPEVLDFGVLSYGCESKHAVVLVNTGLDFLQVEKIFPFPEDNNIIAVDYSDDLILYPGAESQVAIVTYAVVNQRDGSSNDEYHNTNLGRETHLIIQTNGTSVKVPYRAVVLLGPSESLCLESASAGSRSPGDTVCHESWHLLQFQNGFNVSLITEREFKNMSEDLKPEIGRESTDTILNGVVRNSLSILGAPELMFPTVQIGLEEIQCVNVINPIDEPVLMQLMLSSEAGASHCKDKHDALDEKKIPSYTKCTMKSRLNTANRECNYERIVENNIFSVAEFGVINAVVQPRSKSCLGPIVFRPVERCIWTSLLVIKNNLTRVEWVPVQGSGGSTGLTFLDGGEPVHALMLDFNVTPLLPPIVGTVKQHINELFDNTVVKSACYNRISREFLAKNTGDVPLKVDTMNLAGGGCDLHGFRIDSCNGFYLAPGEAIRLLISYRPDLTGTIQSDLCFETSSGKLVVPLKANLPGHVIPYCEKAAFFSKIEKMFLHICFVALFYVLLIFIKMLKQERFLPTDSGHWPSSSPKLLSPVNSKSVGCRAKDHGRQKQKCADHLDSLRNFDVSAPSDLCSPLGESEKTCMALNLFRAFTTIVGGFATTIKLLFNSPAVLSLPDVKVSASKAGAATKVNAGHPRQGRSFFSNGTRIAERQYGALQLGKHFFDEPLESSSVANFHEGVLQLQSTNTNGATSNSSVVSELAQQHLHAVMPSVDLSGTPQKSSRVETNSEKVHGSHLRLVSQKVLPSSPKAESPDEKKEKGKRKKKRNNAATIKQGVDNGNQSGNSSPLSAPTSPAAPVTSSRPVSPFFQSDSFPNPTSGTKQSVLESFHRRSNGIQCPNTLSLQSEINASHSYFSDGFSQVKRHPAGDLALKGVDVACTLLDKRSSDCMNTKNLSCGKVGRVKEAECPPAKDWATVARRAVAAPKLVYSQDLDNVSGSLDVGSTSSSRPFLTTSATFPRGGRASGWSVTALEKGKELRSVCMSSTSPLSSSVVPPSARAPGTRVAKQYDGKPDKSTVTVSGIKNSGSVYSGQKGYLTEACRRTDQEINDFVYDIWGDHFAEIGRVTHSGCETYSAFKGTFLNKEICPLEDSQSFFAKSGFMMHSEPITNLVDPVLCPPISVSSGFSVFSAANSIFASDCSEVSPSVN